MEEEITEQPMKEVAEPEEDFQSLIRGKYRQDYLRTVAGLLGAQARESARYLAFRELCHQSEAVRASYPDFDLEQELENPAFDRLLRSGVGLKTAYEVVHHDALRQAEAARDQSQAHPEENGLGRSVGTVTRPDPRRLTAEERKDLRKRAAKGELVTFD